MKKRIISILLVMVLVLALTLTACAQENTPENQVTTPTLPAIEVNKVLTMPEVPTVPTQETEAFNPWQMEDCLEYLEYEEIEAMTLEEVNALAESFVHLSETANLSPQDMNNMGWMFNHIWYHCPEYDKVKLEKEFCEAFDNVYEHAAEIGFTLDYLEPWIDTPVPKVMAKYLSSSNFEEPFDIWCHSINKLSEEDLAIVAEAFVNNPTMITNAGIARSIICHTNNAETSQMLWEHLIRLSKCDEVATLKSWDSSHICWDIFTDYDMIYEDNVILEKIYNTEYIAQIAENILANQSFDFVEKYAYFCSDFFVDSDVDIEISRMAMQSIQDMLFDSTNEECILIGRALSDIYYNEAGSEMENVSEELREKYIYLLNYCLARMTN